MRLFALLSTFLFLHTAFSAPLKLTPNAQLITRDEYPRDLNPPTHSHLNPAHSDPWLGRRELETANDLERRQLLEAAEIGYEIATNPTVDKYALKAGKVVAQNAGKAVHAIGGGVKAAASKVGGFFGGLFGHRGGGNNKSSNKSKAKAAPKKSTNKAPPRNNNNKAPSRKASNGPKGKHH